mmetsp:Transcript_7571/g.11015  ORF Transcript_7571/g.11015 Transcript_7571/m.11015 type:complete len:474 (+) Transcript_7571:82-1503(+)|eukprot:CAMPEP_0194203072 /NCGR_PEP_ID=MMETSP0156-20130528/2948_1 /TAXON_ID=33649 /ORGANISM="Thalassionema nitzschioides, Strain L26-B" /LENGTH=473 /DNA_ID=CAMNT_0038928747 /DNA_START=60 /DNA_END=1481 /DNA_ORIENTATION=-
MMMATMIREYERPCVERSVKKIHFAFAGLAILSIYVVIFGTEGIVSERILEQQLNISTTQSRIDRNDIVLGISGITPFTDICPAEYPPSHATLHDEHHEVAYYNHILHEQNSAWNRFFNNSERPHDLPKIHEFENYHYAAWKQERKYVTEASAWLKSDPNTTAISGPGWVEPKKELLAQKDVQTLVGDHVAFNSWFPGNFGHFAHDWLPTIALLKHLVPSTTRFLLVDDPLIRKFLTFLDPRFTEHRVEWIQFDSVYYIDGKLTLHVPDGIPNVYGCCTDWDPLRQWIAEQHPDRPEKDLVVFYSRSGSTEVAHGRILNLDTERKAMARIQQKMMQHNRGNHTLIKFNGQDGQGNTLSIAHQFSMFRRASTYIGPHGSGLGGNFLWMDPFSSKCEERPKILEFMPGPNSAQVQEMYASYYSNIRKWPLDYHNLLYTEESTPEITQINLDYLDEALDAMWGTPETLTLMEKKEE